jgi:hypothetical protein
VRKKSAPAYDDPLLSAGSRWRAAGALVLWIVCVIGVVAAIGAALLWAVRPDSDEPRVPGSAAAPVGSAAELQSRLQDAALPCAVSTPFDPWSDMPSDAIDRPIPDSRQCIVNGERVVILVYRNQEDRARAMRMGHINFDLCRAGDRVDHWESITGSNWRIATTAGVGLLSGVQPTLDPQAALEPISCQFSD